MSCKYKQIKKKEWVQNAKLSFFSPNLQKKEKEPDTE